ncbi:MAG TPA: hypothetical protein DCG19_10095, partial [Cryomorphaceae bacterium]|nr:hypothetical protein [Cryomorphaceae bacterium]
MKEGWEKVELGKCIKLKSGEGLTAKKMNSEGSIPVYGGNGLAGMHDIHNVEGENIVIGRVGALCGNARFVQGKAWVTDNAFKVTEFYYSFDLKFLVYLLNHIDLRKYARQSAQPVVSNSSLKNVELSFPKSLSEQQQIVSILDKAFAALDAARAKVERNLANARELFQSKLNEVFSQRGPGWEERKLGEVAKIINGYSFKSKDFAPGQSTKVVKITNVGVKEFVEDEQNTLPESFRKTYKSVSVHEGDLVVALTRTIISSGLKVARVPESYDKALLNQRVAAVVPAREVMDSEYLYFYICSSQVYDYVLDNVNTLM